MDDQEEKVCEFETKHPTYLDFRVKIQQVSAEDVLITIGNGGCYSWNVLTREDAIKMAKAIFEVTNDSN